MKKIILFVMAGLMSAQQTRREITNAAPTAAEDSKKNSSSVPDVYAIPGSFERVLVLRFKFDTDLLAGIQKIVTEEKIRNAVILSGAGSVRNYQVHQVSNRTFPSKNVFVKDASAPADLIGMNGYIINGTVHPHMTLATPDHAFGGHLEPGTNVFTFAIVTLGVMNAAANFDRLDDKTFR